MYQNALHKHLFTKTGGLGLFGEMRKTWIEIGSFPLVQEMELLFTDVSRMRPIVEYYITAL